ncbi:N-acetylmuramoyl-L-alanine amidase, partial [Rhizophagus irregularis]
LAQYVNEGLASKVALRNRGAQLGNYLVLRENYQNAILIELGYLSNPTEERIITTDFYREQATLGIYNGILNYFDAQIE